MILKRLLTGVLTGILIICNVTAEDLLWDGVPEDSEILTEANEDGRQCRDTAVCIPRCA